jgi:hypothetical protein
MGWAGNVARMGKIRNAYKILVRKPDEKRPLDIKIFTNEKFSKLFACSHSSVKRYDIKCWRGVRELLVETPRS